MVCGRIKRASEAYGDVRHELGRKLPITSERLLVKHFPDMLQGVECWAGRAFVETESGLVSTN
jgi:hypothetical protein